MKTYMKIFDTMSDSWDVWGAPCIFAIYFSSLRFVAIDESNHMSTFITITIIITAGVYACTCNEEFKLSDRIASIYSIWYDTPLL